MLMKKNIKLFFSYFFLRLALGSVFLTCRWKIKGLDLFKAAIKNKKPIMLCFWHHDLVYVARYFRNSPLNIYGISSTHFDSQIMASLLTAWNIKLIRGSSTRGWTNVLKKIIFLSKDPSSIIAISNDGPQGPPMVAKPGSLSAAEKYGYQLVVISGFSTKRWELQTWDKTFIPKPFSAIYINFSNIYPSNLKMDSENVGDFINQNEVVL
tara:strand:+ start:438 stop:1064 length:627 start_codon:yes stop_codon:yes gene_type:complete